MHRTPYALAAIATQAIPALDARQVAPLEETVDGFESALVIDAEARHWIVRAPLTASAGAALEAEIALLEALAAYIDRGDLPFLVPRVAGTAPLTDGGRALVHAELPGFPIAMERLTPGPGLAASLGRALAAIHELPVHVVEATGHPSYTAQSYRERRLTEVDEAAATGLVPPSLLKRWEDRLEDVSLWRFIPTVTHGALAADSLLVQAGNVAAVRDWSEVKVADPADDLAWVLAAAPADCVDSIMEAYQLRRTELPDPHLLERSLLASELALLRWLLHGTRHGLADVVADAVEMLADLDVATAAAAGEIVRFPAYGGTGPIPADDVATTALAISGDVAVVSSDFAAASGDVAAASVTRPPTAATDVISADEVLATVPDDIGAGDGAGEGEGDPPVALAGAAWHEEVPAGQADGTGPRDDDGAANGAGEDDHAHDAIASGDSQADTAARDARGVS
ncbi:phosphotransferase [Rarobacter faecitabidus]|uniref:Phosphotransferase family enzyme n=1 Tax=Rarobacter faecitabidus TaxID=13243 RepID=A0A542ZUC3_RARFA|nr:phosphotransferase [Rarobacter faecitabidus]TQL63942.1 phosphotransferase family enzyme [Rarobacter faecitabidus]